MKSSAYIKVSGRVQGVGYRYFAVRNAEMLDLKGYVRNCPDGTVEIGVEGEKETIEQYKKILNRGPRFARVDQVIIRFEEFEAKYHNFSVEY